MPRVSVIMPMKNTARYVREAVTSVLAQDFSDLELVVVDDGSTDGSRAVVEAISDRRLKVLSGPKRGVSAAFNAGFAAASGDIVMQCDSDDLYPPGRVVAQVAFLDGHRELGAVCGGFTTMEPSGRVVGDLWGDDAKAEEITNELLAGLTRTHLCTFAIRRQILKVMGGKREYFETAEDIDLQLRLAERGRVWYQPVRAYLYRLHGTSLTHTQASTRRRFYEQYARDLRSQRAAGGEDDVERGQPQAPPDDASRPDSSNEHLKDMLIAEAWRCHERGARRSALMLGLRAVARAPVSRETWRNLAALAVKAPHRGSRS